MNQTATLVVIGGGYAGINLLEGLRKEFQAQLNKGIKIILVDKHSYHLKKVKLFKAIVDDSPLQVPILQYCHHEIEFVQGELTAVYPEDQKIQVIGQNEQTIEIRYDRLILALGSVPREAKPEQGGISLNSIESAKYTREHLLGLIQSKKQKTGSSMPTIQLRVAVVGGGITGMETSAELAVWLKTEVGKVGMDPSCTEVLLINTGERLLMEAPSKIGQRLEKRLNKHGVKVIHNAKVKRFVEGKILYDNGSQMEVDLCIWTVGVKSHPSIQRLGLSLSEDSRIRVDPWYRLVNCHSIYGIGDCVQVVDPGSGEMAGMTCKEAIAQAQRLCKIIKADLQGMDSERHKNFPDLYCIGLGPGDAFVWARRWGIDFVLSGKVGARIREYTWDKASLIHR